MTNATDEKHARLRYKWKPNTCVEGRRKGGLPPPPDYCRGFKTMDSESWESDSLASDKNNNQQTRLYAKLRNPLDPPWTIGESVAALPLVGSRKRRRGPRYSTLLRSDEHTKRDTHRRYRIETPDAPSEVVETAARFGLNKVSHNVNGPGRANPTPQLQTSTISTNTPTRELETPDAPSKVGEHVGFLAVQIHRYGAKFTATQGNSPHTHTSTLRLETLKTSDVGGEVLVPTLT